MNRLLLLAIALLVTGATIVAFSHAASATRAHASHTVSARVATPQPISESLPTLLPTVIVRPNPEMPTLATITVRPERALRASVNLDGTADFAFDANDAARTQRAAISAASGTGFAMPYYSFSRSPRHSNKE